MRRAVLFVLLIWPGVIFAQETKRHGVEADVKTFPQATPKETLASVVKAVDLPRVDYVIAQLVDPAFVDARIQAVGLSEAIAEATARLTGDPSTLKQLQRLLKEGEWTEEEATALVRLKDLPDRSVRFKKSGTRWHMDNQYRPRPTPRVRP